MKFEFSHHVQSVLLSKAIAMAAEAHAGQVDKAGEPYIFHPLRVAMAVIPEARAAAVLHDAAEDTDLTLTDISNAIGGPVAAILARLTHCAFETYEEYIRHVAADPLARQIKIADIYDNLHPDRLCKAASNGTDVAKLVRKYLRALLALHQ